MNLILLAAILATCSAAKLDRTYLPPPSAKTAGGNPDSLQTPLTRSSNQGLGGLPSGSYENDSQGVVVDAANPGTRNIAGSEQTGLGAPRVSYGSADSKVGEAAFRGSLAGFGSSQRFDQNSNGATFGAFENRSERPQAAKDRAANIVKHENDVGAEAYSYGFETDNGIAAGENGVAINGVQAQGGFSYKGDDGQTYSITYTADEGGYRPQGNHLPTPPPIPDEILKSLEQNAKDEAAGLIDDGSYDAQKYNDGDYSGGDYTKPGNSQLPGVATFNANNGFGKPTYNSGYSGSNAKRPNGNNFGQAGSSNYNKNQYQPALNTLNNGAFNQGTPENTDVPSGRPNEASAQGQFYGNSQASAHVATQGYQTFRPDAEESSSNVDASLNKGSAPASASIQSPNGQRPQNFGSFNRPSLSQSGQTFSNTNNGFGLSPNNANTFASNNYLPPGNVAVGSSAQTSNNLPSQNGQGSQVFPSNHASSVFVGSKPIFGSQSNQFNSFQQAQTLSNGGPAQFTQNFTGSSPQGQSKPHSNIPAQPIQATFGFNQQATKQPDTVLTTPLEPNEISPNKIDEIQPTNSFSSSFASTNSNPSQNYPHNENKQPQFIAQTIETKPSLSLGQPNFGISQTGNQSPFSSQASAFASTSPSVQTQGFGLLSSSQPQAAFPQSFTSSQPADNQLQLSQNTFTQSRPLDAQFASSTQKPTFGQNLQGIDQSYYYNQPSKPFNSPAKPFGPKIPTTHQSNQLTGVSGQYFNRPQNFPMNSFKPEAQTSLNAGSPNLEPTSVNVAEGTSPYYNGVTQASISPFGGAPTPATHTSPQSSQLGSKPSQFNQPAQSTPVTQFGSQHTQFSSQQTQFGAKPLSQQSLSENNQMTLSQFSQQQNQFAIKPSQLLPSGSPQFGSQPSQFEPKPTQQFVSQFNQQNGQSKPPTQLESQQAQHGLQQTQFGSQQTQFGVNPILKEPSSQHNQQITNQFGSQQVQFGSQQAQFGIKPLSQQPLGEHNQAAVPTTSTSFGIQQTQFGSSQTQFGVKPLSQQPLSEHNQPALSTASTSFGPQQPSSQQTQFDVKPLSQQPLSEQNQPAQHSISTQFNSQQTQFGSQNQHDVKPLFQQNQSAQSAISSQFGSQQNQFGLKPQQTTLNQQSGPITGQFGFQNTQTQQSQFGNKPSSQSNQQSINQFGFKPHQGQSQFNQPTQSSTPQKPISQFNQNTFQGQFSQASVESKPSEGTSLQSTPSQQYTGELYEYNKPEPVPDTTNEGQTGQNVATAQASVTTGQTDSSVPQNQDISKPTFGTQATLTSQSNVQSSQFGAQPFRPFGNGKTPQNAQSSTGNKPQFPAFGKPCCQGQKAQTTQTAFEAQTAGSFNPTSSSLQGAYKPSQGSEGFGKGEVFGGQRNPPKFDDKTGYHY